MPFLIPISKIFFNLSTREKIHMSTTVSVEAPRQPGNTINVSLQRSPVFYANLTKRFMQGGMDEVKLAGLGNASSTAVGATEILKRQAGLVNVKKIETSLTDRGVSRLVVVVGKGDKFDDLQRQQPARNPPASTAGAQ